MALSSCFIYLLICLVSIEASHLGTIVNHWKNKGFTIEKNNGYFHENRITFDGIFALETTADKESGGKLILREVSDGRHLWQAVYHYSDLLFYCDVINNEQTVRSFFKRFFSSENIHEIQTKSHKHFFSEDWNFENINYLTSENDLNSKQKSMLNLNALNSECQDLKADIEDTFEQHHSARSVYDDSGVRRKRALLIYPSTKWCGRGSNAVNYTDLGTYSQLDACCRSHDMCDDNIPPLSTAFNYLNYGLTTISHCDCDVRFYDCLKDVTGNETSSAQMVGRLYFNVMGKSCFLFRRRPICMRRSYWGFCMKYKKEYTAVAMSSLTF